MEDFEDMYKNISNNESYDISTLTISKDDLLDIQDDSTLEETSEKENDYPVRCPDCWESSRLSANITKKNYMLMCDQNHKNMYTTFKDLIESSNKKFNSLLCSQCKTDKDVIYRCNDNNLFYCCECKNNDKSKKFINIDDIDNTCSKHDKKYKYYDTIKNKNICEVCFDEEKENYLKSGNYIEIEKNVNYKDIDKNYKKAIENIKMWDNTCKLFNHWLKNFNDIFNEFLTSITNYCLLQLKIVSHVKKKNSLDKFNNNFNIYCNYEAINDLKTDTFIRETNEYINVKYNKSSDISSMSKFFISIFDNFKSKDINIEAKCRIVPTKKVNEYVIKPDKKIKEIKEIKNMFKKKFELESPIKCFIPFNKESFIILGMKTGEIIISEVKGEDCIEKLRIKVFEREIEHLCEIDKNLIIATDINKQAKIIEMDEELKNYIVVKEINFSKYTKIYKIISLPILSYFKNRHYFAVSVDNLIQIYSSNKMPTYLDPPYIQYHNYIEEYSIEQPSMVSDKTNPDKKNSDKKLEFDLKKTIKLNYPSENIIEVNDKYLAVAFQKTKCMKLYNMQKDFIKEDFDYKDIISQTGSIMKVSKSKTELVISNETGLNVIDFNNIKKVRNIKLKHNFEFFDFFDSNNIVCLSSNTDNNLIKQYMFKDGFKDMKKVSEFILLNEKKITNFMVIKSKIYYTDDSNIIHYYEY